MILLAIPAMATILHTYPPLLMVLGVTAQGAVRALLSLILRVPIWAHGMMGQPYVNVNFEKKN